MRTFAVGKDCLFNTDSVSDLDYNINELDAYIQVKEQQNEKVSFEEGMTFDEITEIASNRIADIIREQLDTHLKRKIGCASI